MRSFYDLDLLENQVFGEEAETNWEMDSGTGFQWEQVEEWETPGDLEGGKTVTLTLTVDGGNQVECRVIGVFLDGEKERIALELPEGGVQIMELEPGEDDGINLTAIEGEEEQQRAIDLFLDLFGNDAQQGDEGWESGLTDSDVERESDPENDAGLESSLEDGHEPGSDPGDTAGKLYQGKSSWETPSDEDQEENKTIESEINHDRDQNREKN